MECSRVCCLKNENFHACAAFHTSRSPSLNLTSRAPLFGYQGANAVNAVDDAVKATVVVTCTIADTVGKGSGCNCVNAGIRLIGRISNRCGTTTRSRHPELDHSSYR